MSTFRRRQQPSALLSDGTIDVNLIEREIRNDLSNDLKYRAEDGMKKRAIHTSKNYDEFRAFVSCAELQPVGRSDVRDLFQFQSTTTTTTTSSSSKANAKTKRKSRAMKKTSLSRQHHAMTKSSSSSSSPTTTNNDYNCTKIKQRRKQRPRNGDEFLKEWHGRRRTLSDKIHYLTASLSLSNNDTTTTNDDDDDDDDDDLLLPPSIAPTIFRIHIDATITSDIIKILHVMATTPPSSWSSSSSSSSTTTTARWLTSSSTVRRCRWMFDWLEALTVCNRFSLSVEFLSGEERDMVTFLIYYLSEELFEDYDGTAARKKVEDDGGVGGGEEWEKTEEDWRRLKLLYKV